MATTSLPKRAQTGAKLKVQDALEHLISLLDRRKLLPSRIDVVRQQQAPCSAPRSTDVDLLNVADAAAALGLSPKTLANWRVSGAGPRFSKIGGRVAYMNSDLQAFVAANFRQSTSDNGGR